MGTQTSTHDPNRHGGDTAVDLKLEVVVLPVSDVDRAKAFYEGLGWRLDADFANGEDWRLVQMTPPGSPCSVMFGKGFTNAAPGSVQGTFLVVENLETARASLAARGLAVSGPFHFQGDILNARGTGRADGPDPQDRSYFSFASFNDPDGNGWLVQEVTSRFPGRGFSSDIGSMIELLHEADERHAGYQKTAAAHDSWEWYAAYVVARQRGRTPSDAAADAAVIVDRSGDRVPV
jgi:catechol 2,3-dioxygenase-like lactoylglutathione lyase family enzyme